jgi:hypothetical protein
MAQRKRQLAKKRIRKPIERKPVTPDPTLEEIWGTPGNPGLAELIRMERGDGQHGGYHGTYTGDESRVGRISEYSTLMLPFGFGKLLNRED